MPKDPTLISVSALAENYGNIVRASTIQMPDHTQGQYDGPNSDWLFYVNSVLRTFNIVKLGSGAPGGTQFSLNGVPAAFNGSRFQALISGIVGVDYLGCNINLLVDGPTVTPNFAAQSYIWRLSAGGSRTIAAPTNLPTAGGGTTNNFFVIFDLLNNTGGAITTTFNAIYKVAWVDPAAGKRKTMIMYYDGTNLIQVGAISVDL